MPSSPLASLMRQIETDLRSPVPPQAPLTPPRFDAEQYFAEGGAVHMAGGGFRDPNDPLGGLAVDPNDPRQWLQFGGQDMQAPPVGLPVGQAVGTSMGYHAVEGLQDAAKLANQVLAGEVDPRSDEGIQRAMNAAMTAQLGGIGGAPARAGEVVLGSGPVRRAAEAAAIERELSPLGFYSHGAETAAGLPQAKGTPQQMAGVLRQAGVRPEELFTSGFADEAATMARRTQIEAEYAPKIEAAKQAVDALNPESPEFAKALLDPKSPESKAKRQYDNTVRSMRGDAENALVLSEDFASRPSVTREEIAAHFKERMPQIEETVLAGRKPVLSETEKEKWIDAQAAERARDTGDIDHVRDWADASPEIRDWHREEAIKNFNERMVNDFGFAEQFNDYVGTPTKFSQYTLPGGENYREVLLKLPERGTTTGGIAQKLFGRNMNDLSVEEGRVVAEEMRRLSPSTQSDFTGSHWNDPNVLAHLRMADRTGPNGEKILHVEEIQSDWGQKGKKEGFKQQPDPAKEKPLLEAQQDTQFAWEKARSDFLKAHEDYAQGLRNRYEQMAERWGITPEQAAADNAKSLQEWKDMPMRQKLSNAQSEFMRSGNPAELPHYAQRDAEVAAAQKRDEARNALIAYQKSIDSGTPTAPYVTNTQAWTDLALKRALREAAEGGYDKLVWTPGAEQAKRYKLSNHVNSIDYMREGEDAYRLGITNKQGEGIDLPKDTFTAKELEEYLGKEVAQKIVDDEGKAYRGRNHKTLEGLDLEVGGSGMKGYYDKIVPTQLSKLVKKLDPEAKIGAHDLITKEGERLADAAVFNGNNQLIEKVEFWDDARAEYVRQYRVTLPDGQELGFFEDFPDAHNALSQALGSAKEPDTILKVPSLTITPKMRDAIMKGQTAYAQGGEVEATPKKSKPAFRTIEEQVTAVASDLANIARKDNLDQRHVAYLLKVASGMYMPPERAMEFAGQIMVGDAEALISRFKTYRPSIRTFARLNQMMGGKHKFMQGNHMGANMMRMKGEEALMKTKENLEGAMDSDIVRSRPAMKKALEAAKKRM